MAANCDLVIVHGPPSPAVQSVLRQRLSDADEYIHVHPAQLYKDHPGFGVRDIANYVLGLLKKHKRVVVEDSCAGGGVRDCLLKVVPSKLPACKTRIIELRPRHGQQQTLWERQFILATCQQPHLILSDEQVRRWFDEQGFLKIPESSSSDAGLKETVSVDLTAITNYKFEVPSLLVQWECIVDSGGYLQGDMTTVCQQWVEANPCGRVIVLCDGAAVAKGHLSAVQQKSQIYTCTKALMNELPCAVYGLQVTSTMEAGEFSLPPNPGLLAFLQRRHCIDLHHRSTVYVYSDTRHMKMAERAGVRHIKIGKVLKNPQMMKTCHSATAIPVSQMLQQLQLVRDGRVSSASPLPSIPLADRLDTFTNQCICIDHPRGLREFLFAQDNQILHRFQTEYTDHATPVGEPGSRMEKQETLNTSLDISVSDTQATLKEKTFLKERTSESGLRSIPKWMLRKTESSIESQASKGTLEKSSSTSSQEGRGRSRHTVYIMTEKELLETAKDALKQAGREDLIKTCIIQTTEGPTTHTAGKITVHQDVTPVSAVTISVDMKGAKPTDPAAPPDLRQQDVVDTCREKDRTEVTGPTVAREIGEDCTSTCPKKQRLSPTTEGEGNDRRADILHMASPQKNDELEPTSSSRRRTSLKSDQLKPPCSKQQRMGTVKPRKAPDLSVLDEIFF